MYWNGVTPWKDMAMAQALVQWVYGWDTGKRRWLKVFQEVEHDTLWTWNNYWSKSIKVCYWLVLEKISEGKFRSVTKKKKKTYLETNSETLTDPIIMQTYKGPNHVFWWGILWLDSTVSLKFEFQDVSFDCLSRSQVIYEFLCENRSVVSDSLWPHVLYSSWNSLGQNTGVGSLSLLQRIFPTQGSNPGLLHCRWILSQLNHKGSIFTYFIRHFPISETHSQRYHFLFHTS